jgi:hypothetical protein
MNWLLLFVPAGLAAATARRSAVTVSSAMIRWIRGYSVGAVDEVIAELGRDDHRRVLMLGDGGDFLVRQLGEGDAVFER